MSAQAENGVGTRDPLDELVDVEAERDVLGVILARPDAFDVLGPLTWQHFGSAEAGRVFKIASELRDKGRTISVFTVAGAVRDVEREQGQPDSKPLDWLNQIALDATASISAARESADVVRELYLRRRLTWIGQGIANDAAAMEADDAPADQISRAVNALQDLLPDAVKPTGADLGACANAVLARAFNPDAARQSAMPSGLSALDERTGGFKPGELIIVAGRPGMGKSLFAGSITRAVIEAGYAVASFQLEMTAEDCATRFIADLASSERERVWYSTMRKGEVLQRHQPAIERAALELEHWPLLIDDRSGLRVDDILSTARTAKRDFEAKGQKLGLVVVDHIGLVQPSTDRRGNKVAEMTDISGAMKRMAKELGCVVLALSQLNRGVEGRDDKRPLLSDLRESGSLEQDADAVLLLYRPAYYLEQKRAVMAPADFTANMEACRHVLEVNSAKVRGGAAGIDVVDIDAATGSIRDKGVLDV